MSLITLLLVTDLDTLDRYRFWAVGSLVGRALHTLAVLWPFMAVGGVLALTLGRALDALSLGDDTARALGHRLGQARATSALAVVLLCGTATALAGPIAFVGLLVPHLARRITGPGYPWILAYALLLGPMLLVVADVIGRLIAPPGELEAGLVIAFLGAPVLILFVRRTQLRTL
jgi:iron complex transport system permease protein